VHADIQWGLYNWYGFQNIHHHDNMLIGVAQLINKLNGLPFEESDEIYFEVCR